MNSLEVGGNSSDLITIDLGSKFQTILGWGGAFTDAATINIASLPEHLSEKLLASYYGYEGLQYNFGRIPIAGSDFSTHAYSYDDSPDADPKLEKWKLQPEDIEYKIPCIRRAQEMAHAAGNKLNIFGSPWSPPRWMKDNNSFVRGHLKDEDEIYKSYAQYLVNFFEAYRQNGLKFWGATVQNEPVAANLPFYYFNSLQLDNAQLVKFVTKYLGPTLHDKGYTRDTFKLMVGDDSLGFINFQVPDVMKNPEMQRYVSGLAFHWYTSGLVVPYDALTRVLNECPDKFEFVMMSEACTGSSPADKKVDLGSWERGEAYASDIIEDFQRQTGVWIDWNLALDMEGGPNWVKNFVDSPIIVNAKAREFYKQPMYYALGHFSRFFRPGFVRVGSNMRRVGFSIRSKIMSLAAVDKEGGHLVVTLLNKSNINRNVNIELVGAETSTLPKPSFKLALERKSLTTVVMKL